MSQNNITTVVLAGGTGSRLKNLTSVVNKSLLPLGDRLLLSYILEFALSVSDKTLIITNNDQLSNMAIAIEKDDKIDHKKVYYATQDYPYGIADAIKSAEEFTNRGPILVILGDNIYSNNDLQSIRTQCELFNKHNKTNYVQRLLNRHKHSHVWLYPHDHPERYGVISFNDNKPIEIEEKPTNPNSNLIISGIYLFDESIWDILPTLQPSDRGEYEITDILRIYMHSNDLKCHIMAGEFMDIGESVQSYWNVADKFLQKKCEIND